MVNHRDGILQRQGACRPRGRHFPRAVPEIRIRREAFLAKYGRHADLHGKQKGLRDRRVRQIPRGVVRRQNGRQTPPCQGLEICVRFLNGRGKSGV